MRDFAQIVGWGWMGFITLSILYSVITGIGEGRSIRLIQGEVIVEIILGIPGLLLVRWGRRHGAGGDSA